MFSGCDKGGVEVFSLDLHGKEMELQENFKLGEFACKDGSDEVLVHPALVLLLQEVRNHFDSPVKITSAYRTEAYNARIGGAQNSRHVMGLAADIRVKGVPPKKVREYLEGWVNPGGIGYYKTFTHVDVQGNGRRWNG